jgi:hypothetical protein
MAKTTVPRAVETAKFISWIDDPTITEQLVNDLKVYTWEIGRECAVVMLRGGKAAIVAGGYRGISFELRESAFVDPFGARLQSACIRVDQQPVQVDKLICHTHPPPPSGPSDDDFKMLEILGQEESIIFEINGEKAGTRFSHKKSSGGTI